MSRKLSNWLSSYMEYAQDGFVPHRFHLWSGLSILAASLERRVALKQGLIQYVPNIYVMLVSHPKGGKSTAVVRAADLVEDLKNSLKPDFRILPNQMTEPAFIDLMKIVDQVPIPGTTTFLAQSAGFFYASEASSSALRDPDGFIVSSFTDFWDCPRWFRKKLKTERDSVEIENTCLNLLAGTTFNFLRTLVNEQSVLGGFASRLIYVVEKDRPVRSGKWENPEDKANKTLRSALVEDLYHITQNLIGPIKPTPEWIECYENWIPKFDASLNKLKSEKLEGITARKDTNLLKVSMLLSVAESDSLIVTGEHFAQAAELIDDVYKDYKYIVDAAVMADKTSQAGLNLMIKRIIREHEGKMSYNMLKKIILEDGYKIADIKDTLDMMVGIKVLKYSVNEDSVALLNDTDSNL